MQAQSASGSHHDLGTSQAPNSTSPECFAISELIICTAVWVVRNFYSVGSELRHKAEEYFPAVLLQVEVGLEAKVIQSSTSSLNTDSSSLWSPSLSRSHLQIKLSMEK